jgi:hypothetical protein
VNKLQTVYIPVSEFNSSELIVENEGIHNSCLDRVKLVEAFVFNKEELKQLLFDAFDAGTKSVILQITNNDDNTIGYSKGFTTKKIGELIEPHVRIRDKEEYIENFLNKEK